MAVRWSYAEPTPSFADRCLPVVAVYRRWCHKQPVCGLFLLVQLLVFQPALEIYKIQRAEVKLSLKYNEKDGLWPLLCSSCWVFVFVFNIMSVMYFLSYQLFNQSIFQLCTASSTMSYTLYIWVGWVGWMSTLQIKNKIKHSTINAHFWSLVCSTQDVCTHDSDFSWFPFWACILF